MKLREPKVIKCQICGKTTTTRCHIAKYCKKCTHKVILDQKKRAKYAVRQSLKLTCLKCGKDLTDCVKCRKYCFDCRKVAYAEMQKKYRQENKEKYSTYMKEYYLKSENKEKHRLVARKSYYKTVVYDD